MRWLLDDKGATHVAVGRHGAIPATCPHSTRIKAAEDIGPGFAGLKGKADGIALFAIAWQRDIDMELLDGEGMSDLVWGQEGIGRAIEVSDAAGGSLNTAKGRVLRHGSIAQVMIMQGDGHQTISW